MKVLPPVVTVQVSPATASVGRGQTLQLQATVRDSVTGAPVVRPVVWRSLSPDIVSVTASGLATGVSFGLASIEATSDERRGAATIRVEPQGASMAVLLGNAQTAAVLTSVPVSPTVVVRDGAGRGVSGVTVTFDVTENNGIVFGGTDVTDANGEASVATWILGSTVGSNRLRASVALSGISGNPVVFTATGTSPTTIGSCCRRCTTGKPCGDTCIALSSTCRTIGGCACYGASTWRETVLRSGTVVAIAPWRDASSLRVAMEFFPFGALGSFGCAEVRGTT